MTPASMKLIGRGSSKDLYSAPAHPGFVFFEFSDRISVFDYGALPDVIPGKGLALKKTAVKFFEIMAEAGIPTAYDAKLTASTGRCAMRAAKHPKFAPLANLSTTLEFIPLEVIFRFGATPGSSLLKRRPDLKPFARWDTPLIEFSTKLESSDRLLSEFEAAGLAGSAALLGDLKSYAERVALALRAAVKACGLELWDGKIECAVDRASGAIVMVDALTLDEMRVSLPGLESVPLSKELLRHWLGGTNWAFEVAQAKNSRGDAWRETVSKPPRLGAWRLEKLSSLYAQFSECLAAKSSKPLLDWSRGEAAAPKVFVLGKGGRETALRWRLSQEGCEIVDAPEAADAVWVSQDGDLDAGKVDEFQRRGLWAYGPEARAAKIESSKSFGKFIAERAQVRLAKHSENPADLKTFAEPPVVKFDGLAAGKGVVVADSWAQAEAALKEFSARGKVVLEERLRGFEASAFFALETGYGGIKVKFLGTARDFKRRFQSDEGPNTGGMGAHAPHPLVQAEDIALFKKWAEDTARALVIEKIPYNGVLYIGALKDERAGWTLLEYNARFGDPETEALVCTWPEAPVLRSLLKLDLKNDGRDAPFSQHALCVALVKKEYPESSPPIDLPNWDAPSSGDCVVFKNDGGSGRVAFVVGRGATLLEAGDQAFDCLLHSPWKEILDWRSDIIP